MYASNFFFSSNHKSAVLESIVSRCFLLDLFSFEVKLRPYMYPFTHPYVDLCTPRNFFPSNHKMQFSCFSRFTIFFSFYLWCALVSFISISPCPLGAFGLSQLSAAAARPSTNGLSRLLHNSFADCVARAKGCNGGQETQLLPFVVPRLVFTSFLCPVHSCATALQLHWLPV